MTDSCAHMKTDGFRRYVPLAFAIIVALQVIVLICAASLKADLHIDEVYSYVISNSAEADRFSNVPGLQNQWVSGSDFDKVTTVQDGDQLDFVAAYNNTSTDCHPPMYYWALHAVCSLFPGLFSKWTGIGLNIVLFIACQVLIYLISKKLIRNDLLTLVPSLLYGFTALCVGNVEFIRMYVLLAALCMLYVYQSLLIAERGVKPSTVLPCCATVFVGAMTQYYFLFFVFWMALIYGIWLLSHKRVRDALIYGVLHIVAVVGMLLTFPFAIAQATGSSTNNVGNEVSQSMFDLGLWKHQIASLFKETLHGISYAPHVWKAAAVVAFALVLVSLVAVVAGKKHGGSSDADSAVNAKNGLTAAWLFAAFVLTFLTVSKVGGNYVYVRYIYFVVPVVFICFGAAMDMSSSSLPQLVPVTMAIGVAFGLVSGGYTALRGDESFTFTDSAAKIAVAKEYKDVPLVVLLANSPTTVLTSNYTLIRTFDFVYAGPAQSVLDWGTVQTALRESGRCIVFIPTASGWTDGLDVGQTLETLKSTTGCGDPQYLFDFYFGGYYLLSN